MTTFHTPSGRRAQAGITMVMALICLALMLVASVALTRSSTNSLLMAGNLAFKQDLLNQAERGMAAAVTQLGTGNLSTEAARTADRLNDATFRVHYSATMLCSNAQGIPNILVNSRTTTTGTNCSTGANMNTTPGTNDAFNIADSTAQVTVITVIDRQCVSGTVASDPVACVSAVQPVNAALTGTMRIRRPKGQSRATYRISVRVVGPRGTEAFHQMIVAN